MARVVIRHELLVRVNVPAAEFVRKLLSFYDPNTFRILFGSLDQTAAEVTGSSYSTVVAGLQDQVRQLERLLGKKTAELELLREERSST